MKNTIKSIENNELLNFTNLYIKTLSNNNKILNQTFDFYFNILINHPFDSLNFLLNREVFLKK
jgi:hypothetical protein